MSPNCNLSHQVGDVLSVAGDIEVSDLSKRDLSKGRGGARESSLGGEYQIVRCLGRGEYETVLLDKKKKRRKRKRKQIARRLTPKKE